MKQKSVEKASSKKNEQAKIKALFAKERVIVPKQEGVDLLLNKNFGTVLSDKSLQLSLVEALYLLEKGVICLKDGHGKDIDFELFVKKASRIDKEFWTRYLVFKDLRTRGYVVKTALKFGADFRVYERGVKPGQDHAKWVVFPVHESSILTWHDFAAKNRVAHSTKKRLMIAIVDDEADITYYEVRWLRP